MLLRNSKVTVTDLDILLFLHESPRSVADLRGFLSSFSDKNVSTYTGRLKAKQMIEKRGDGMFTLSPQGEQIISKIKAAVA